MNRRKSLIASVVLIGLGFLARLYADRFSYVSSDGMLHDSIWLPIGTLMLLIGLLLLLIAAILYGISALKR